MTVYWKNILSYCKIFVFICQKQNCTNFAKVIVLGIKEVLDVLNVKSTFFLRFAFSPIVLDTREKIMEKKKKM